MRVVLGQCVDDKTKRREREIDELMLFHVLVIKPIICVKLLRACKIAEVELRSSNG